MNSFTYIKDIIYNVSNQFLTENHNVDNHQHHVNFTKIDLSHKIM